MIEHMMFEPEISFCFFINSNIKDCLFHNCNRIPINNTHGLLHNFKWLNKDSNIKIFIASPVSIFISISIFFFYFLHIKNRIDEDSALNVIHCDTCQWTTVKEYQQSMKIAFLAQQAKVSRQPNTLGKDKAIPKNSIHSSFQRD